jgi:hypothetical protein
MVGNSAINLTSQNLGNLGHKWRAKMQGLPESLYKMLECEKNGGVDIEGIDWGAGKTFSFAYLYFDFFTCMFTLTRSQFVKESIILF